MSPATAATSLEEMFSSGGGGGRGGTSKRVTVLLVDEMDLLVTKKQSVCLLQQDAHMHIYLHAYTCLMRILVVIPMFWRQDMQ